jgi:4-alpha-glucanotransferase
MQYGEIQHFQTGVAIPVSALRSHQSCGIGEFADLAVLAEWANRTHMDLVQILPINDTGHLASPYSALSAFALHPIYLRLQDLPGIKPFLPEIQRFSGLHQGARVDYAAVLEFKQSVLFRLWEQEANNLDLIAQVDLWIEENPWVRIYALYLNFKGMHEHSAWWQWPKTLSSVTDSKLKTWTKKHLDAIRYHAWIQMHASLQLRNAVLQMEKLGVKLKGDIPILINEDSADSWGHPELFDMKNRAGAPPDMFCYTGQNWGFPCYRWDVMKSTDYAWWRARLRHAAQFYHAFRIDHVLGFFRIWEIPTEHRTGMLGRFVPSLSLSSKDLKTLGCDDQCLELISVPHFKTADLDEAWDGLAGSWSDFFVAKGDWWVFKPELKSENDLEALSIAGEIKGKLFQLFWNRILLRFSDEPDAWYPYWYHGQAPIVKHLNPEIRDRLHRALADLASRQEAAWEVNGETLLRMMSSTTDMLVCAEDLGVVPDCVGPTLERLGILSLKIERWARDYHSEGQPFVHPAYYPRLSVNSPSCHDTSTLRGWWEEPGTREEYSGLLGMDSQNAPEWLTTEIARKVLERNLSGNSLICLFPLQDWLALHYDLRTKHPIEERVNVPGSLDATNWSYRMKMNIEDLIVYDAFNHQVTELVQTRRNRAL